MIGITVEFAGVSATFAPGRTVRVGREPPCDVVVADRRVSRRPHLELSQEDDAWVMTDRSRGGTYLDGVRVQRVTLDATQEFRLGSDPEGPTIRVSVGGAGADAVMGESRAFEQQATLSSDDASLRLTLSGSDVVFPPGATVLVGRAVDCDLRTDSLLVSRHHLRFVAVESGWLMEDLGSERGTYVDGRRLVGARPVSGAFTIQMGGSSGGVALDVVTAGTHHPPDKVATVTTVFTDLTGSTELLARLGDSAADDFFRDHAASLSAIATEHAGDVIKNTGDGLMIVFPSAAGALDASVAMQRALDHVLRRQGVAMRIGLATGDTAREMGDWFGLPVVQAARLCALAEGGQILAGEFVLTAAGGRGEHAAFSLGMHELKGLPAPVHVFDIQWEPPPGWGSVGQDR